MPKAYGEGENAGFSNHLADLDVPDDQVLADVDLEEKQDAQDAEVMSSVGTSSLLSETKQDKSGQTTTSDPQSPVHGAENLSETDQSPTQDQLATQESSSANLTVGSTQETGFDLQSQQSSSEDEGGSKRRPKRS